MTVPRSPSMATAARWRWEWDVPAGLISVVVHLVLVVLLGWTASSVRYGIAQPNGGLIALSGESTTEGFFDDEPAVNVELASIGTPESGQEREPPTGEPSLAAASSPFGTEPPVDVRGAVPSTNIFAAGGGLSTDATSIGVGDMTEGPGGKRDIRGSRAKTRVYGVEGEGSSFVFVFDRSASMSEFGGAPMASAKAELIASLAKLEQVHQFQIIFYNHEPATMPIGRQAGAMAFASEESKRLAERYIHSISPNGGTQHEAALEMALRFGADCIFFLTDAAEPGISSAQLHRIRQRNAGRSTIHTIEFGQGPPSNAESFLAKLARENGGAYAYVDITRPGAFDGSAQ